MARKSTGDIEEGYADFNGQSSRSISFELTATGAPNFTSPPQVKLASIERIDHLYKYLFFEQNGDFKAEYSAGTVTKFDGFNAVEDLNSYPRPASSYRPQEVKAVGPSAAIPYQSKYIRLSDAGGAVGFSFAEEFRGAPINSNTVVLYFQLWFTTEFNHTEKMRIFFGKLNGNYSTDTSDSANNNISLTYNLKVNNTDGDWVGFDSNLTGTGKYIEFERQDVDYLMGGGQSKLVPDFRDVRWCKLSLTGTVAALGKFTFIGLGSVPGNMNVFLANPIIHYADDDLYQFRFNPNIGVTFKDVTTSGMKILCSAPLHGRIRYLLSF